jgi:hypothetical protein
VPRGLDGVSRFCDVQQQAGDGLGVSEPCDARLDLGDRTADELDRLVRLGSLSPRTTPSAK